MKMIYTRPSVGVLSWSCAVITHISLFLSTSEYYRQKGIRRESCKVLSIRPFQFIKASVILDSAPVHVSLWVTHIPLFIIENTVSSNLIGLLTSLIHSELSDQWEPFIGYRPVTSLLSGWILSNKHMQQINFI